MATTSGPRYQLLVANLSRSNPSPGRGADPAISRPTKIRSGFEFRHVQQVGLASSMTNATRTPSRSVLVKTYNANMDPFDPNVRPNAVLEVVSDTFALNSASVLVGPYELVSGRDFATGGGLAATATNLAAAISNLPGYDATPAVAEVTVQGPRGQIDVVFRATYRGGQRNFSFTYPAGTREGYLGFGVGVNPEEPPVIIPPASLQGEPYQP